jgi:hypothetical protein
MSRLPDFHKCGGVLQFMPLRASNEGMIKTCNIHIRNQIRLKNFGGNLKVKRPLRRPRRNDVHDMKLDV